MVPYINDLLKLLFRNRQNVSLLNTFNCKTADLNIFFDLLCQKIFVLTTYDRLVDEFAFKFQFSTVNNNNVLYFISLFDKCLLLLHSIFLTETG